MHAGLPLWLVWEPEKRREDPYCMLVSIAISAPQQHNATQFTSYGVAEFCKGRSLIAILQRTISYIDLRGSVESLRVVLSEALRVFTADISSESLLGFHNRRHRGRLLLLLLDMRLTVLSLRRKVPKVRDLLSIKCSSVAPHI
jgi:hypothetical protein